LAEISPAWRKEPPLQSFALIDDPDAPMGNGALGLSTSRQTGGTCLETCLSPVNRPNAVYVGKNSSGNMRYDGPCPPSGTHRYYFKLYALDTTINLLPGATKDQVLKEMEGHILGQGELMGTFSK
jgi:Raf kinase inhibitor-like YbhB/YbcL family protein